MLSNASSHAHTRPTGHTFLSYKRDRVQEAMLLIEVLREHGVPTWHDLADLDEEPTEEELRRVLRAPETASAVLWMTPEVQRSPLIRQVEAPEIIHRARQRDGFFVVPVVAGGLDYAEVSRILDPTYLREDLTNWNVRKVTEDPIDYPEAASVAQCVVRRRLRAIDARLEPEEQFRVGLYARAKPTRTPEEALQIDWHHHFERRVAGCDAWTVRLLPALAALRDALREIRHRPVVAGGSPTLAMALAFGRTLVQPAGFAVTWEQKQPGGDTQSWGLSARRGDSDFQVDLRPDQAAGKDLAVLLSVTEDVRPAFRRSRSWLPDFRAVLHVAPPGPYPHEIKDAHDAVDVAHRVIEGIREARRVYAVVESTHAFLAAPAGLAVLMGQLMNTLGPVQVHEHEEATTGGHYVAGPVLLPL